MDSARSHSDVLVIGGGIAGVSIAYRLATDRSVAVLEAESTLAFHTTGRSAALYIESYGNAPIRALTTASRAFLTDPPEHFDRPILTPRGMLEFAVEGRGDALREVFEATRALTDSVEMVSARDAAALIPFLRPDKLEAAMYEAAATDIDVNALHTGFVRGIKARGSLLEKDFRVAEMSYDGHIWTLVSQTGQVRTAEVVVNAAGAWADAVGQMAGATRIGLVPMRRTAFMTPAPPDVEVSSLPTVSDLDETFYIKPQGHQLLCSPADETPSPPCDAKPDELEIARALDAISEMTTLTARRVLTPWAGLRSFVVDRTPVVGYDPLVENFFWCAGQGGYGIQTCAALSQVGAALLRRAELPDRLVDLGLETRQLSAARSLT